MWYPVGWSKHGGAAVWGVNEEDRAAEELAGGAGVGEDDTAEWERAAGVQGERTDWGEQGAGVGVPVHEEEGGGAGKVRVEDEGGSQGVHAESKNRRSAGADIWVGEEEQGVLWAADEKRPRSWTTI